MEGGVCNVMMGSVFSSLVALDANPVGSRSMHRQHPRFTALWPSMGHLQARAEHLAWARVDHPQQILIIRALAMNMTLWSWKQ